MHVRLSSASGPLRVLMVVLGMTVISAVFIVVPFVTMNLKADTPQTYTVTNLNDGGPGSLRTAIANANSNAGGDRIEFTVSGTITLVSGFTGITDAQGVTIDGTTAPDSLTGPDIILDGSGLSNAAGLFLNSSNNTILGLKIANFPNEGIRVSTGATNTIGGTGARDRVVLLSNGRTCCSPQIGVVSGASNTKIVGNYIGVDVDGATVGGNAGSAIQVNGNSSNTVIGGSTAAERNVIAGGTTANINLVAGANTIIQQNYLGVAADGTTAIGTTQAGIIMTDNTDGTQILQNVISNNTAGAIRSGGADDLIIKGNYIGLNATGTAAIPNQDGGNAYIINLADSTNFTVGGTDVTNAATRNVISGNTGGPGSTISVSGASDGTIQGNYIGLNAAGDTAIANQLVGIWLTQTGAVTIKNNVISGNTTVRGIFINSTGVVTVDRNSIGVNSAGTAAIPNKTGVYVATSGHTITNNLISGNSNFGVVIASGANTVTLYGNKIGVNADATAAIPNGTGIDIQSGVSGTIIGGTTTGQANIIGGNTTNGISVAGSTTTIQSNFIGTTANGLTNLANGSAGIIVRDNSTTTTIGGVTTDQGNIIAFNTDGVKLEGLADLVQVRKNLIYANTSNNAVYLLGANGGIAASSVSITSATSSRVAGTSTLGTDAIIDIFTDTVTAGMHTYQGTTTVAADGTYELNANLGTGTITVVGTTTAGRSAQPQTPTTLVLDSQAPTAPVLTSSTAVTNDPSYTFAGTKESYSSLVYNPGPGNLTGVNINSSTTWTLPYTLNEGLNHVIFSSRDYSANTSPTLDVTILLDTVAPSMPAVTSPTIVYDTHFVITGTRDAYTNVLLGDGSVVAPSSAGTKWTYGVTLAQGDNTFRFKAQDAAGNESSLVTYTVRLPPPPSSGGDGPYKPAQGVKGPAVPPPVQGTTDEGNTTVPPPLPPPHSGGPTGGKGVPPPGKNTTTGGSLSGAAPHQVPPVKNPLPPKPVVSTKPLTPISTDTSGFTTDVLPSVTDSTGALLSSIAVPSVITEKETPREIVDAVTAAPETVLPEWWTESYQINPTAAMSLTDDIDNDGVSTIEEYAQGTDPLVFDSDSDGISDSVEIVGGTSPSVRDTDNDGLSDGAEYVNKTDPHNPDTDGDGYTDGVEAGNHESDPISALSTPVDRNQDGFADRYKGAHDDSTDSDNDGLTDLFEYDAHTDPYNADSDGDGVSDGAEVLLYESNPKVSNQKSSVPHFANWDDGDISSDNQPFMVGTGTAGTTVEIVFVQDGVSLTLGTTTVNADGTFTAKIDQALLDGTYYIFLRMKDPVTGAVENESYPVTMTIDSQAKNFDSVQPLTLDGQTVDLQEPLHVQNARPQLTVRSPIGVTLHVYWKSFLLASVLLTDLDSTQISPPSDLEPGLHTVYIQAERDSDHTQGPMQEFQFIVDPTMHGADALGINPFLFDLSLATFLSICFYMSWSFYHRLRL